MSGMLFVVVWSVTTIWFGSRCSRKKIYMPGKFLDSNFEQLLWSNGWELEAVLWRLAMIY